MLSPDFLAYARTWTTCTYGVCQRKPCTVLLNSMGGRGSVPSETVEVLMLSCRQPLRSASLLVVSFLWSNTTNRYFRYAACVILFQLFTSLPVLRNTSFSLRLLPPEIHVSSLFAVPDAAHYSSDFLSLSSALQPLWCVPSIAGFYLSLLT